MAPLGYIEILDGKGNVSERVAVESFPIHIGRALTNQVILGDPYVCPMHLLIEPDEQGRLVAHDLDSLNGLHDGAPGAKVSKLELGAGTPFRIGHTMLRYRSIDQPLAPTLIDRSERFSALDSPYLPVAVGLLVFAFLALESFLSSVERVKLVNIISEPLPMIATMLGWAGLWALAGRIVVSRFHFAAHLTIAGTAMVGFTLLGVTSEWLEFFFPSLPALWSAALFGSGLVLAAMVYGHLGFASPLRRRSRFWAALLISGATVGMNVIMDYAAHSKFSTVMEYNGILKPVDSRLLPAISVGRFIDDSRQLKAELDSLSHRSKTAHP